MTRPRSRITTFPYSGSARAVADFVRTTLLRLSALTILCIAVGCRDQTELTWDYGACSGQAGDGIQGTSLLATEFADRGYQVSTARTLGRSLNRANVVVWFPDSLSPPSDATCEFFNQWLCEGARRTLIYVGRDFDGRSAYWRQLLEQSEPHDELAVRQHLARSQAAWAERRAALPAAPSCAWFTIDRDPSAARTDPVTGPLVESTAAAAYRLTITDRIKVTDSNADVEAWLSIGDQPMITSYHRAYWQDSRLLLVTNASTFLNLSMIQPAHQRLATKVIEACGPPGRCVFLISKQNDPTLASEAGNHHLVKIFTTPPFSSILMHLSMMGLIYCFAVYPIFGRARQWQSHHESDFGLHVEALGRMLAKAQDSEHADRLRQEYVHRVAGHARDRSESGESPFEEEAMAGRSIAPTIAGK